MLMQQEMTNRFQCNINKHLQTKIPKLNFGIFLFFKFGSFQSCQLGQFRFVDSFSKVAGRKPVVSFIVKDLDSFFLTVFFSCEISVKIIISDNSYVDYKRLQNIQKILFGIIRNDLVYRIHSPELDISFYDSLGRPVFGRTVVGRINLQTNDQIITDCFGFLKHFDMTGMQ
jgi:hypothetical protein